MTRRVTADVAVVGAGLSGLVAARRLAGRGLEVVVVEAKDRVGGRTASRSLPDGARIESGGQFTGPGQDELHALAAELGVGLVDVHAEGDALWVANGTATRYTGFEPPLAPGSRDAYRAGVAEIDALAATVPLDAPWDAPDAGALDGETLAGWLAAHVPDPAARDALDMTFKLVFGLVGARVSMLHAVSYVAACGGWEQKMDGNRSRFVGGSYELSARMAAALGDRVVTHAPVRIVQWSEDDGGGVVLRADGLEVRARRCVVALQPGDCRALTFSPPLPRRREQLHRQWQSVSLIKAQAVYDTPFWRAEGLSGLAQTDLGAAPFIYDNSPADGTLGVLLTFMYHLPEGTPAGIPPEVEYDPEARRAAMLQAFAACFGPQALEPVAVLDDDWLDVPFTSGCSCPQPPGLLTQLGPALTAPVGPLHWASSETSPRWNGWMAGAVVAGERAADAVTAALGQEAPACS